MKFPLSGEGTSAKEACDRYHRLLMRAKKGLSLGTRPPLPGSVQLVDLFCGCGGISAGFHHFSQRNPSFELAAGVDINEVALATYRRNLPGPTIHADLGRVAASRRGIRSFLDELSLDSKRPVVLVGGPPCQGFSAHRKKSGVSDDPRNSLVLAYGRIAVELSPEMIVMENVPEILSKKHWPLFQALRNLLQNAGYHVRAQVHNLAQFGVPQARFRALVIARRRPFTMPIAVYPPNKFRSVRDAIGHLPRVKAGQVGDDPMHFSAGHKQSTIDLIKSVPKDGGSRPAGLGPRCLQTVDGFRDVYGRMYWDRPCNTITANSRNPAGGRFVHPEQDRGLTIREAALLQGFPSDYLFEGSFDDKFAQIGNAVPVFFASHLACHIWRNINYDISEIASIDFLDETPSPLPDSFSSGIAGRKSHLSRAVNQ